jgi:hypothetical protein
MADDLEITFTGAAVRRQNDVFVTAEADSFSEQGIDHTILYRWRSPNWGQMPLEIAVVGLALLERPKMTVLNVGATGEICAVTFPGANESIEIVDHGDDGPSELLNLRGTRVIDGQAYVVGMGRHVYVRGARGNWAAIDNGVFLPRHIREEPVGLNALDGTSKQNIYAVGFIGEIWHFDGTAWRQEQSPTNVALNDVVCGPDGTIYACGMSGTLVRGATNQWQAIPQDATQDDFWGITQFRGKIYASNYEGVFALSGDSLVKIDMGLSEPITTAYLDAADGVMWSVGHKNLAYTTDGVVWTTVPNPPP